ncbi:heavy-metal-associated domain-containing protein [Gemmatimonadota bacterium]
MNEVQFRVPDMSCGHCTAAVQKALELVTGVTGVEVSLESKTAKILYDKIIDSSALSDAIRAAGYTPEPFSIGETG